MKTLRVLCTWLPALLLAACVLEPRLVPGPGATLSSPDVAYTEVNGVRVWAHGLWEGNPDNLEDFMTPVRVTLQNNSGHELRISYRDFALIGQTGFRYAALPPFPVTQPVSVLEPGDGIVLADYHPAVPVKNAPKVKRVVPRHTHTRFYFAPPYSYVYPNVLFWPHPWAWSIWYTDMYRTWPQTLPTDDMQAQALPEGVLQEGGTVGGYLYFQRAAAEPAVTLQLALADANTQQNLGTATLPFVMRR